jgi:dTDP-4-dehydrorhamnose 3,5-epimerase
VKSLPTKLEGPLLLEPVVHRDQRGFFIETYRHEILSELGATEEWVQDNHSRSVRGVVRGLHFQPGMSKLVRCARGTVIDVLVDIRKGSPQFGQWEAYELSDENLHVLYAPDGFAHGFCVTSEVADLVYKCSAYYDPETERGIAFNDPEIGIEWPELELTPSERDSKAPLLGEIAGELPFTYGG